MVALAPQSTQGTDNFGFNYLLGTLERPFRGYNSAFDKTKVAAGTLIRGSYNVYKTRSGSIANRCGLKLRGDIDDTEAGVKSGAVWVNSKGHEIPVRVINETSEGADDASLEIEWNGDWYPLTKSGTTANPAGAYTRFVFDSWYDSSTYERKDRLLFVRGNDDMLHWSGGVAQARAVTGTSIAGGIASLSISAAGTNYVVGDIVTIAGGTGGKAYVQQVSTAGAVTGIVLYRPGSGYSTGAQNGTGGSGSSLVVTISSVKTMYSLQKLDTTTTWEEDGFTPGLSANSNLVEERKFFLNNVEYTYVYGTDTDTLEGVYPAPVLASGDVAIQSVFVNATTPASGVINDFLCVHENQVFIGGYNSSLVYISADVFSFDFTNGGSYVYGDPDVAYLDSNATGMVSRKGQVWVSAGTSDWYAITPNFIPPVSFVDGRTGNTRYFITKVEKHTGSGLVAALAHEFITKLGDNVIYVSQDHQLREIGDFNNLFSNGFPSLSLAVEGELMEENLDGGQCTAIGDIVYILAPVNGRHWMYQVRKEVNEQGNVVTERLWHPPQVSGLSRIVSIGGVIHGFSNAYPQIYEIWDTDQWHDDSPGGDLPYNCVARFSYLDHGSHVYPKVFGKIFSTGLIEYGTQLYGNAYYEYQGALASESFEINTDDNPATLYSGSPFISLGGGSLGDSPLGTSPLPETNGAELLPKWRAINDLPIEQRACIEYSLEVVSGSLDARWELSLIGTDAKLSRFGPTYLQK